MTSRNLIGLATTIALGLAGSSVTEQKVDAATIEIDAWQDLKRVEVPFDLTVGLGL